MRILTSSHALPAGIKPRTRRASLLLATAALTLCTAASGKTASLPAPTDLKRDAQAAAAQRMPVVVLVSMDGCAFCDVIRRNYLLPLTRASVPARPPVIRELDMSGANTFSGFDGKAISHAEFAKAHAVRVAPTVLFLGPSGEHLAEPLVGGDVAGMYAAYLDRALAEASRKLSADRQGVDQEKKR